MHALSNLLLDIAKLHAAVLATKMHVGRAAIPHDAMMAWMYSDAGL